jgi:hypothetical protein
MGQLVVQVLVTALVAFPHARQEVVPILLFIFLSNAEHRAGMCANSLYENHPGLANLESRALETQRVYGK